jgi:hypothetical protein
MCYLEEAAEGKLWQTLLEALFIHRQVGMSRRSGL